MKKHLIKYITLTLLTSCLGEGGEKVSLGNYPGVIMQRADSTFVCVKGGDILFAPAGMASTMDGDCVLIDFTLDHALKENADSGRIRGFLTVEMKRLAAVPLAGLKVSLTDTAKAISGERLLSAVYDLNALIRDRFFLFTGHKADSLPLSFDLSCNLDQAPGDNVYDLFLRLIPKADSAPATQPTTFANAFDLSPISIRQTDSLFFRLNYVRQFNADSSAIGWASTPVFRYSILR